MTDTFKEIQDRIKADLEKRNTEPAPNAAPVEAPKKKKKPKDVVDDHGAEPVNLVPGQFGVLLSSVGSEVIRLETSTLVFMECDTPAPYKKHRYCIVEKNTKPIYPSQWMNSQGYLTHIVTEQVFMLILGLTQNLVKQLRDERAKTERTELERDSYKTIVDTLRQFGVVSS